MSEKPAILRSTSTAYFKPDVHDTAFDKMSTPAKWEKSYLCPCRRKDTRQPDQACHHCKGRGIAFLPPRDLKILIQSEEKGVFNGDLGLLDFGTAIGTPAGRETRLAFRDRITILGALVSQSFIFNVTEHRIKNGFYMVYDVHQIEYAVTLGGELTEGDDYEFDRKNNLFIPKSHLLGKNVSINILTTLRYLVADLLKEHRYQRDQAGNLLRMQQKLLLKREDCFIDKEAFDLGVNDTQVMEMIEPKRQAKLDGLNGFFSGYGGS
ncbi:hypothetical protein 035JT004_200 [Bacillus phage 035JT004]|nr:hypothetical protein 035JT004_200 [Bacillus phage 035JT004]